MNKASAEPLDLIMLSAMYENGGNTLHRLLDGHRQLLVYPFESQLGTPGIGDYLSSMVPVRYRWPQFSTEGEAAADYEAFWDEELKTYLRVPGRSKFRDCGLDMRESDRKLAFAAFMRDRSRTRPNLVRAYFHSAFAAWGNIERTGLERFYVGYNPVIILDADKITADFPSGHLIHVVRNPWSGYADTKKRPFPLTLERYAWTWSICQHAALTWAERAPGRVHIIRFEDIVADTKAALGGLLQKLGLEWDATCLAPSFNRKPLAEVFPWGTIREPSTGRNIATMAELSGGERRQIAQQTGVMCRLLGYEDLLAQCLG